jgi:hypothetical protein
MNDFTFAGGDQVIASGQLSFAFGNQVTVSSRRWAWASALPSR